MIQKRRNRRMYTLYGPEMRMHTVHVHDVARAAWHAALWMLQHEPDHSVKIYNLADPGKTSISLIFFPC